MNMERILTPVLALILLFSINSCSCKPKTIIKTEYIKCEFPEILDLNYTLDTNYSIPDIRYEIIEENSTKKAKIEMKSFLNLIGRTIDFIENGKKKDAIIKAHEEQKESLKNAMNKTKDI